MQIFSFNFLLDILFFNDTFSVAKVFIFWWSIISIIFLVVSTFFVLRNPCPHKVTKFHRFRFYIQLYDLFLVYFCIFVCGRKWGSRLVFSMQTSDCYSTHFWKVCPPCFLCKLSDLFFCRITLLLQPFSEVFISDIIYFCFRSSLVIFLVSISLIVFRF